jgi:hypothetical protein
VQAAGATAVESARARLAVAGREVAGLALPHEN